jgi:hypothetical protein
MIDVRGECRTLLGPDRYYEIMIYRLRSTSMIDVRGECRTLLGPDRYYI